MPPVRMSDERKFLDGLKKLFQGIINDAKRGLSFDKKAQAFLESDEVDSYLRKLVTKMTKNLRVKSAASWREAASKGTNGRMIYNLMKNEMNGPVGARIWEIIENNVSYIKTLPLEWANYASNYAARETFRGKRPEAVEAALRKVIPEHMAKNLKCIARTECAKANAAIVQARAEMCGIQCYFWRCVMDNRSRDSHMHMDKVLVFYDDPPSPEALIGKTSYGEYHAGNTFNCRCYQEVVVDVRFLPDTFKYYHFGTIQTTTRNAFLKKFGNVAG